MFSLSDTPMTNHPELSADDDLEPKLSSQFYDASIEFPLVDAFALNDNPYFYYPSAVFPFGPQDVQHQQEHQQQVESPLDISSPESNSDIELGDAFSSDSPATATPTSGFGSPVLDGKADDHDYNVALKLSKDVSMNQYMQYTPEVTANLADCFSLATDETAFVSLLSSGLPQMKEEANDLFSLDAKSMFSNDINSNDNSSYFGDDTLSELVRRKSLDEILLRKIETGVGSKGGDDSFQQQQNRRKSLNTDLAQSLVGGETISPSAATKHSRKQSKTIAPFACPHDNCPKTFTRQYNLKSHLRTHTDERPFICNYPGCPRAFARQHDLKRHQKLHLGLKPHVCANCGRAFARLDALNRHLRSDNAAQCAQATLNGTIGHGRFKSTTI